MSASPMARQVTDSQAIPTKRVFINDPSELPHSYSSTPGGTLYSTTPGGTKIVYEKSMLMNLRNSPIAKTPPRFEIPDSMMRGKPNTSPTKRLPLTRRAGDQAKNKANNKNNGWRNDDEDQFQIDI